MPCLKRCGGLGHGWRFDRSDCETGLERSLRAFANVMASLKACVVKGLFDYVAKRRFWVYILDNTGSECDILHLEPVHIYSKRLGCLFLGTYISFLPTSPIYTSKFAADPDKYVDLKNAMASIDARHVESRERAEHAAAQAREKAH